MRYRVDNFNSINITISLKYGVPSRKWQYRVIYKSLNLFRGDLIFPQEQMKIGCVKTVSMIARYNKNSLSWSPGTAIPVVGMLGRRLHSIDNFI